VIKLAAFSSLNTALTGQAAFAPRALGFPDTTLPTVPSSPTIDAPDGRLFVCEQGGTLRVIFMLPSVCHR
jgi:hypothetical protein